MAKELTNIQKAEATASMINKSATATGAASVLGTVTPDNFRDISTNIKAASAAVQNEFYKDFLNKVVRQVFLRTYETSEFRQLMEKFSVGTIVGGDKIEVVSSGDITPININYAHGAENNPNITYKVDQFVVNIKLGDAKVFPIKTNIGILSRAMTSVENLESFVQAQVNTVLDSMDVYYWDELKTVVVDYTPVTGAPAIKQEVIGSSTSTANELAEKITAFSLKMNKPTAEFNEGVLVSPKGAGTAVYTPKKQNSSLKNLILVINADRKASFEVSTFASLFHSDLLTLGKIDTVVLPFTKADGTPVAGADKMVGILMDKNRIKTAWTVKKILPYHNPADDSYSSFGHTVFGAGHVQYINCLKLVIS